MRYFFSARHRAPSRDKILRWALQAKTRAIVSAIEAQHSGDEPLVVQRVTLSFALDAADTAASGRRVSDVCVCVCVYSYVCVCVCVCAYVCVRVGGWVWVLVVCGWVEALLRQHGGK